MPLRKKVTEVSITTNCQNGRSKQFLHFIGELSQLLFYIAARDFNTYESRLQRLEGEAMENRCSMKRYHLERPGYVLISYVIRR